MFLTKLLITRKSVTDHHVFFIHYAIIPIKYSIVVWNLVILINTLKIGSYGTTCSVEWLLALLGGMYVRYMLDFE